MTQTKDAFGPSSVVNNVARAALESAIPGMGGVSVPGFSSSSSASGKSGDVVSPFNNDASGFSVNYGNGVSQGSAKSVLPSGVWLIAAAIAGAVAWKRYA